MEYRIFFNQHLAILSPCGLVSHSLVSVGAVSFTADFPLAQSGVFLFRSRILRIVLFVCYDILLIYIFVRRVLCIFFCCSVYSIFLLITTTATTSEYTTTKLKMLMISMILKLVQQKPHIHKLTITTTTTTTTNNDSVLFSILNSVLVVSVLFYFWARRHIAVVFYTIYRIIAN